MFATMKGLGTGYAKGMDQYMTHLAQMLLGLDIQPDRQLGMLLGITLLVEMNQSVMPVLYLQAQIFHNLGAQPPPRSHQKRLVLRKSSTLWSNSGLPLSSLSSFMSDRFSAADSTWQLFFHSSSVLRWLPILLALSSQLSSCSQVASGQVVIDDMTIVLVLFIVFPYEWNTSFLICVCRIS